MARSITDAVLDEVWRRDSTPQGAACRYCGAKVVRGARLPAEIRAHFDVVDPNEPATVDNVVVSCPACNMRKGDRTPSEAGMTLLPAAQCESGVDRSAETDAAVKDAFVAAVRSLAPKPGGSGYNFDRPADHWVSQFADAVRALVRDESDRAAILATLLPWTNHQRVACDEREAAADRNLAAASARLAAARHFEMKAKQRVADASASLANLLGDADGELEGTVRRRSPDPGSVAVMAGGKTTVSLYDEGKPGLSITGTDASRVYEAAAAIRAAESKAGA